MDYNVNRNYKGYYCRYQEKCIYWKHDTCFFKHIDKRMNENNTEIQTNEVVKRVVDQTTLICGNWIQNVNDKFEAQRVSIVESLETMQDKLNVKIE